VRAVVDHHNAERAARGLGPLALSGCLSGSAQSWAERMASTGGLAHNPSFAAQAASCVPWMAAAENVGQDWSVEAGCAAWMNHSSHRSNILNPAYTQIGVGIAQSGGGVLWLVVDFVG